MPVRREFTDKHEEFLAKYIAKYNPQQAGRQGNALYQRLYANKEGKWPWAKRHPWQSWREHYQKNQKRMDAMIKKYIQSGGDGPSQIPAPSAPSPQKSPGRARVPFSQEDDDNLVEYLATRPQIGSLNGQKFWQALEQDDLPWIERHSWQSWRERYKKNAKYFDWAVRRYHAGDDFDEDEVPRPKTVENQGVPGPSTGPRVSAQVRSQVGKQSKAQAQTGQRKPAPPPVPEQTRKRARASEAKNEEGRPVKKKRVEETRVAVDREEDPGPSTRSQTAVADDVEDEVADKVADADGPPQEDDAREDEDEVLGSDEEDDSAEEEPDGPVGSDDYRNEIFDSPPAASAADDDEPAPAGEQESTFSDSEKEQDELDELLEDDGKPAEDVARPQDTMEVDQGDDPLAVPESENEDQGVEMDQETLEATDRPQEEAPVAGPSGVNAASSSANRYTESHELSPTQEAAARHQDPRPGPRQHAKRIKRAAADDFFGTPPPAQGTKGRNPSSPTAEAEARHHAHDRTGPRQPPRLVEGPFNKAFSDSRGRPRTSPTGKGPRRSGVNFDDEADVIGVQDTPAYVPEADEHDEEHESELAQWPPVRRKSAGKAKQRPPPPATPSPMGVSEGKQRERTVTTKTVSVRTVHTVERRVDRRPKGTPFPRGKLLAAAADEDEDEEQAVEPGPPASQSQSAAQDVPSPASDDEMEVDDGDLADDNTWLAQSQHHPFSQVPHPFSQHVAPSPVRRPIGTHVNPLPKADVSRFQSLLNPGHSVAGPSGTRSASKPQAQVPRPKRAPLGEIDSARLEELLRAEGRHPFPEPSKPSPDSIISASPSDHPDSSPLADKGDSQSGVAVQRGQLFPAVASGSRDTAPRVDKGKGRADRPPADAHRRYTTAQDVFWQPEQRVDSSTSKQPKRRSLSSRFHLGDNSHLANYSALSLAFGALPFGHARTPSIPSTKALSRSVSPAKSARSANASLADTLPESELEMVKELGMNAALHIMARNHGFNEDTVRAVYLETGSLQLADNVLREMREGANDRASEALSELMSDEEEHDEDQDDEEEDDEEEDQDAPAEEEAEVERELTHPPEWPQDGASFDLADEAPLAESSRIDASHVPARDSRKRHRLFIQPVVDQRNSSVDTQYSPPKNTRAAKHLKRERESLGQSRRESAPVASPRVSRLSNGFGNGVEFGTLARLKSDDWQKLEENLGKGAAKMIAGQSLAKFLQQ
ncbi:hypothetical protein VTO73DRAFT_14077 [Trametes versicolor]